MFLLCQHEDTKDEFGRQEHFDEQALLNRCPFAQGGANINPCGKKAQEQRGGRNGPSNLGEEEKNGSYEADGAREE